MVEVMSLQSNARKHPILTGLIGAIGFAVIVLVALSSQGLPISAMLSDNLFRFVGLCAGFGAVMTLMVYASRLLPR
jgi:hypothetical protein